MYPKAAKMVEGDEFIDLNISQEMSGHLTIADAIYELVANALDADPDPDTVPKLKCGSNGLEIKDEGRGLKMENFVMGSTQKGAQHHGIGLKDAVCVIMRLGGEVEFISQHGSFTFLLRKSKLGPRTIHLQCKPPGEKARPPRGTICKISAPDLPSSDIIEADFLRMRSMIKLARFRTSDLEVFKPDTPLKGEVFVDGLRVKVTLPLYYTYNIIHAGAENLVDREHKLSMKKFRPILKKWAKEIPEEGVPDTPQCEFDRWKNDFYTSPPPEPQQAAPFPSCPAPYSSTAAVQAGPQAPQRRPQPAIFDRLTKLAELHVAVPQGNKTAATSPGKAPDTLKKLIQQVSNSCKSDTPTDIIKELDQFFRNKYKAEEVFRAGSLKKGTATRRSDVDMVIPLPDLPVKNFDAWMPALLEDIRSELLLRFPERLEVTQVRKHSLEVRFDGTMFDLLPVSSKFWNLDHDKLLDQYQNTPKDQQHWLMGNFANKQVEQLRDLKSPNFKYLMPPGLIRVLKTWVKQQEWLQGHRPKSYILELLVLHLVRYPGESPAESVDKLLLRFWSLVDQVCQKRNPVRVTWGETPQEAASGPVVMCVANRFNNVASAFKWEQLWKHAQRFNNETEEKAIDLFVQAVSGGR